MDRSISTRAFLPFLTLVRSLLGGFCLALLVGTHTLDCLQRSENPVHVHWGNTFLIEVVLVLPLDRAHTQTIVVVLLLPLSLAMDDGEFDHGGGSGSGGRLVAVAAAAVAAVDNNCGQKCGRQQEHQAVMVTVVVMVVMAVVMVVTIAGQRQQWGQQLWRHCGG